MISKHIETKPENDNYARLADYIADAKHNLHLEREKEPNHEQRYHPEPYLGPIGNFTENGLRRLSECHLASGGRAQEQERKSACLLSIDARPDRRATDSVRWNSNISHVEADTEKCLMSWFRGGLGGDNYKEGIGEVVDVQAMNTRTTKEKTYHLMVSFRPEDEARLTPELYRTIEERFAKALGFTEHQRHCGVHQNTGNLHMHIGYNMIHPERFTRHEPFGDYHKRDSVCRQLEKDFGLVVDAGIDPDRKKRGQALQPGAATVEAHTGQQSFESYVKQFHEPIMQAVDKSRSWQALHSTLAMRGIELVPHGNGLVFREMKDSQGRGGKHAMKASALDRLLSKKHLEARFGPYVAAARAKEMEAPQSRYTAEPLHRGPERGQLYQEYQAGIQHRKNVLGMVDADLKAEAQRIHEKWEQHRREIMGNMVLSKAAKGRLAKLSRLNEQQETLASQKVAKEKQKALTQEVPYASWVNFLRMKALGGNDTALAVLRSRGQELVEPEQPQREAASERAQALERQTQILTQEMTKKGRKRLLAMEYMREIAPEAKCDVDKKGTLIFTLPEGGTVRDSGKKMTFSPGAAAVAMRYAQRKWGKERVRQEDNVLVWQKKTIELQRNKNISMEI